MDLSVQLANAKLRNPLMLASGVVGNSTEKMLNAFGAGASCIVTKSVSLEPREGYPEPTTFSNGFLTINAVGLSNPGVRGIEAILERLKNVPFIVSVFGKDAEEYAKVVSILDKWGPVGFELNLSCPHVKGYGIEIGHDPSTVAEIVEETKKQTSKPIFAKLSPNTEKIIQVAKSSEDAGADGVVAINTVKAMLIDVENGRPVLSNKIGGLSGEAVRPIALRCVFELYKELAIPVIGVGGISKWEHVVQFMMAGARAVQIGTAAYFNLDVFGEILRGLEGFMRKKSINSLEDIVGLSHKF